MPKEFMRMLLIVLDIKMYLEFNYYIQYIIKDYCRWMDKFTRTPEKFIILIKYMWNWCL